MFLIQTFVFHNDYLASAKVIGDSIIHYCGLYGAAAKQVIGT